VAGTVCRLVFGVVGLANVWGSAVRPISMAALYVSRSTAGRPEGRCRGCHGAL